MVSVRRFVVAECVCVCVWGGYSSLKDITAGILHAQCIFAVELASPSFPQRVCTSLLRLAFLCVPSSPRPLIVICTWLCQSWIVFVDASCEAGLQLLDQAGGGAVIDTRGAAALGPEGQQGQLFVEFWYGWKRRGILMRRE